ncbi:type IV pilus modification protein PilV [Pseudomonas sp.]|uniref:type IV pilus modification protein PilV n=1 Tax=Pseudomonas sp. TaxID=306 RepID=UPI002C147A46|nr:type IV pilus modification protein PilV [Pseudomonas sp.]HUE90566.1 type IV pilus modification protein PilV [Pseudomonas sp.]
MSVFSPVAQRGTTLIEVLIAMIVLAIGLLGMALLQVTSVQSNHSAYYRSQVTLLASDMADRMRANRTEALNDAYKFDFPVSSSDHSVSGTQAQKDIAQWLNTLALTLPEGTGQVEKADRLVTISVRWNDSRGRIKATDGTDSGPEIFVYRTEI